jgi:hypothetical protein|tara:strand:+ start:72 stop:410 length:339 start_codon:yes stop_codon:yes gene_type:complete
MAYASGKHALGICDRCGWKCEYLEMKKEWNGLKVCPECYEPKQPQLTPVIPKDSEALFEPRPEVSLPRAQLGSVTTTNQSAAGMSFKSDPIGSKFEGETATSELGSITVSTS